MTIADQIGARRADDDVGGAGHGDGDAEGTVRGISDLMRILRAGGLHATHFS